MEEACERSKTMESRGSDRVEGGHISDTVGPASSVPGLWLKVPSNAWIAAICPRWDLSF